MEYFLQYGVLVVVLFLSINCIRAPMKIARVIVWWAKLVSSGYIPNDEAHEAIDLMENNPNAYEKKYLQQLAIIKLTGWIGLFVSLTGFCILTISQ